MKAYRKIWDARSQRFMSADQSAGASAREYMEGLGRTQNIYGRYIKGPVPWVWVVAAAALPGKALIVGLALWRLSGSMKTMRVMLANSELAPFGIDRAAKSRAVASLEKAGLVEVIRQRSRFPIITLLVPDSPCHSIGVRGGKEGRL